MKYFDIDPIDVDADGIAESQKPAAGGEQELTLNGALCDLGTAGVFDLYDAGYSAGIGGVRIGIASDGNDSGRTFTVTGTDHDGNTASEDITGPNATTVESTTYCRTIASITTDGDTAGNITVGPVDEIITVTYLLDYRSNYAAVVAVTGLSGTCQFDIDESFDDVYQTVPTSANWLTKASNQSADVVTTLDRHATACRLKFDSYTNGAELQLAIMQRGSD